jgi:hypothetical protein
MFFVVAHLQPVPFRRTPNRGICKVIRHKGVDGEDRKKESIGISMDWNCKGNRHFALDMLQGRAGLNIGINQGALFMRANDFLDLLDELGNQDSFLENHVVLDQKFALG